MVDKTAPSTQLRLDWVYGYRGHQCRNNLFYTSTNEIVYFVAGVGIVFNKKHNRQKFFLGHNNDIISLSLHPDGLLVATGQVGKDPYICVWGVKNCETVSILKDNHQRGIACVAFNSTGNLLGSVGLEDYSQITVWDWKKGKALASTRGHSDRVFDLCFNPFENNKLVTCGVKHIKFWDFCGNTLTGKKGIFGKKGEIQTVLCVAYGSGNVLYSGTLSGDIYKWNNNTLVESVANAHSGGIFTLFSTPDGFASGSKDGTVGLWDAEFKPFTRIDLTEHSLGYRGISIRSVCWNGENVLIGTNGGEIFEVQASHKDKPQALLQGHSEGELWGLAVHPNKLIFLTASDDCSVRSWDMTNKQMLSKVVLDLTARSAGYSVDGLHVAIGHGNGSFRILKARDLSDIIHIHDRKEAIHEIKYSPDNSFLAVGSNDNFVDIYSVKDHYKRVCQCKGSSSYITHVDWSEDAMYLQTNSGAGERLFYKIPGGKRVTKKEEIESIHWNSWTCVLGPEVHGIWEKYTDTTDINATDANFQLGVIVTGDDFGLVKLFRFPCIKKGAKFRKYVGHSAHVTNIRFSADGLHVISTGGADHAVFQWRVLPEGFSDESSDIGSMAGGMYEESNDEASDSDLSDVNPLDSDVEGEVGKDYSRDLYKEDVPALERQLKTFNKNDGNLKTKKPRPTAPLKSVRLNFVFGYRGYDCRNNLFYTQSNEIVYHVAAVGIVYKRDTHTQRFYLGHDDDILCLSLHPIKDYVATGQVGRDPTIHIWDAESLEAISILKGQHSRGVCALDFSADGKKLASIGLDDNHLLVVWDWRRGEKLATARAHKDKIFEVRWDSNNTEKLATVGVRHIKFWTQVGGGLTSKRGTFGTVGKSETMMCITYPKSPGIVVSGTSSGNIYVWNDEVLTSNVQAHKGPVFAIHALEKGFVSGGKDGIVCLWDENISRCLKQYKIHQATLATGQLKDVLIEDFPAIRAVTLGQGKILVGTKNSEIIEIDKSGPITLLVQGHSEGEVWGLAHHPSNNTIATMSDDESLRIWNLENYSLVKSRRFAKGGRCLCFSPNGKAIAIGFIDGSFQVVSSSNLENIVGFHHRKEEIADIKFSPGEGKYLAVASHDNFVDIYSVIQQTRVGICKGASSYITHVDWDDRGKLIQVNSGASELLYFEAPRGKRQALTASALADIKWASWTCVLGKTCEGIWPTRSDVTDINASDLTKDGQILATGDDFGFVKLFEYPTKGKNAKCKKYNGHSAHVSNVRWSHDDQVLVSTGGADTSVMVWQVIDKDEKLLGGAVEDIESDSDSEEESGYDSDVEREKNIDYTSKIYISPLRNTSKGSKPQEQVVEETKTKKVTRGEKRKTHINTKDVIGANGKKKALTAVDDLCLEYIHGYRGFDTRNNLHYTADGEIIYPTAGAVVISNVQTKTQRFYLQHTDDILCLTLNQNPKFKNIVASGQIGVDPSIHIWDIASQKTLSILQGFHKKGICSVDFSSSGRYLVSVGLDDQHSIAVWKWNDGSKIASSGGHGRRIFCVEFRPDSDVCFVTCGVKHISWWNVTGGTIVQKKGNLTSYGDENVKMQTMLSIAFGPNNTTFSGSMNGDVFIWSANSLIKIVKQVHFGPVFSMYTTVRDGLIVTGGKDNGKDNHTVKLWDQEMKRSKSFSIGKKVVKSVCRGVKGTILVGTQTNEIYEINEKSASSQILMKGHADGELWGLTAHPTKDLIATGSYDKTLRIWDLYSKSMHQKIEMNNEIRCCCFSPDGHYIAVGFTTGEFTLIELTSMKTMATKRDRNKCCTQIRFSPDGRSIAVGSEDNAVDFYSISKQMKRVGYCKNISTPVSQLDFSSDGHFIQVCTESYERIVFSVPDGTQIADDSKISEIVWNEWSSTLGRDVIGIWPKNAERGDINSAHLSHSGKTLASGDDYGYVKLFPFPVHEKYTKGKKFIGHSAHVTNVRFSHDDRYLVSIGGEDCSIFIWKCT